MDESKSLAFRAIEELLKAQNTRSQLTRRFVMAELKDSLATRREKARNAEVLLTNNVLVHSIVSF